jgi:hypothetical protein
MMIPGTFKDYTSVVASAVLAAVLALGLQLTKSAPKVGVPLTAVAVLLVGGLIALASQGRAWRNGKLADRGIPSNMAPAQPRGPTPTPTQGGGLIDAPLDEDSTTKLVDEVQARVHPFLERFGPLPTPRGYTFGGLEPSEAEVEEAQQHLDYVERVINGANGVEFQVEADRVRLMLLVGERYRFQLTEVASMHHDFERTPESRCLYGLALMLAGKLVEAEDMLGGALDETGFDERVPEARYHYAFVVFRSQGEEAAKDQFRRFLQVVGDDPATQPAHLRPLVEQALAQLR